MQNILIRRAEREDASRIFALARLYTTGRESIGYDDFAVAFDNVLKHRDHETNVLFVAVSRQDSGATGSEDNAKTQTSQTVVGYTLMTVSRLLHAPGLTAHLQEIVVAEDQRGNGVGESLMRANETYCASRGVRQISASTARIGSFYDHLGYESVGQHFRKLLTLG